MVNACSLPWRAPVGRLVLAWRIDSATWSMPIPRAASTRGSAWTRTAYFCDPYAFTWATPLIIDSRWATTVWAYSSSLYSGSVSVFRTNSRIDRSAGFTFWNDGGVGMSGGRTPWAFDTADWTS